MPRIDSWYRLGRLLARIFIPTMGRIEVVGRENVIAGTDCGLGGRVHTQLAWAKAKALVEGAQLATKELWS